jgi:hypothetical protein
MSDLIGKRMVKEVPNFRLKKSERDGK